ncbi:MAG: hypothetical protein IPG67_17055 [Acidobacteria bacterium]|nr:hypothetical protein [Acidobacteriota bacterium]
MHLRVLAKILRITAMRGIGKPEQGRRPRGFKDRYGVSSAELPSSEGSTFDPGGNLTRTSIPPTS